MCISELSVIAARLEGFEETIISSLIERGQLMANPVIYRAGESGFSGEGEKSLLDIRLEGQEAMDSRFGRFCVAEERPFSATLPEPCRQVHLPLTGLKINDYNRINLCKKIYRFYLEAVPTFCRKGDDEQYGSSVTCDVFALQALSTRIHYGAFYVAERKFRSSPEEYSRLIAAHDRAGLLALLRRPEVEERIVERVRDKMAYLQAKVNQGVRTVIDPETVLALYQDHIIPLTCEGEIDYLLARDDSFSR